MLPGAVGFLMHSVTFSLPPTHRKSIFSVFKDLMIYRLSTGRKTSTFYKCLPVSLPLYCIRPPIFVHWTRPLSLNLLLHPPLTLPPLHLWTSAAFISLYDQFFWGQVLLWLPTPCKYKSVRVIWLWNLYPCCTANILTHNSRGSSILINNNSLQFEGPSKSRASIHNVVAKIICIHPSHSISKDAFLC